MSRYIGCLFTILFSLIFSISLWAQNQPQLADPADAGDELIQVADRAGGAGDLLIYVYDPAELLIWVDARGETLTIDDGRGVDLIEISADGRGVGLNPQVLVVSCEEALNIVLDNMQTNVILAGFESEGSACSQLRSILVDLKLDAQKWPLRETETIL